MNPQVTLQTDLLHEFSITNGTFVRIKLQMPLLVGFVGMQQDECFLTLLALVRSFPEVDRRFMSCQQIVRRESLATDFTPMFPAG